MNKLIFNNTSLPSISDYRNKTVKKNTLSRASGTRSPLISIITVVRNAEGTIERTINSVLNQTFKDYEYIIIDGNSSDKTLQKILPYKDQISFLLSEPDHGISDAFNKGVAVANGKLIGILNADDWYLNDTLETISEKYHTFGENVFHGDLIFHSNTTNTPTLLEPNINALTQRMSLLHPTAFIPKIFYENYGLFRTDLFVAMDYEILLRFYKAGLNFIYINKPLAEMSGGGNSDIFYFEGLKEVEKIRRTHGYSYILSKLLLPVDIIRMCLKKIAQRVLPSSFLAKLRNRILNTNQH